jgi:hypothetical protein
MWPYIFIYAILIAMFWGCLMTMQEEALFRVDMSCYCSLNTPGTWYTRFTYLYDFFEHNCLAFYQILRDISIFISILRLNRRNVNDVSWIIKPRYQPKQSSKLRINFDQFSVCNDTKKRSCATFISPCRSKLKVWILRLKANRNEIIYETKTTVIIIIKL